MGIHMRITSSSEKYVLYSGMWLRVAWQKFTDISQVCIASIFRVEEYNKKATNRKHASQITCLIFTVRMETAMFLRNLWNVSLGNEVQIVTGKYPNCV
jgi:hypothetical protein